MLLFNSNEVIVPINNSDVIYHTGVNVYGSLSADQMNPRGQCHKQRILTYFVRGSITVQQTHNFFIGKRTRVLQVTSRARLPLGRGPGKLAFFNLNDLKQNPNLFWLRPFRKRKSDSFHNFSTWSAANSLFKMSFEVIRTKKQQIMFWDVPTCYAQCHFMWRRKNDGGLYQWCLEKCSFYVPYGIVIRCNVISYATG